MVVVVTRLGQAGFVVRLVDEPCSGAWACSSPVGERWAFRGALVTRLRPEWFPEPWTQLSLPGLVDGEEDAGVAGRWSFAIVSLGRSGRLTLPTSARVAMADGVLRLSTRIEVVVLRRGGAGRAVTIGNRCRIVVPCWLRDAAAPDGAVLVGVGAESDGEPVVLLASTRLLSGFADAVARGL